MARFKADFIIQQLIELKGNVAMLAKKLGVSRTTIYNYVNRHPSVKRALNEARESMLDNVESQLYTKALAGNMTAIIFFLKTQGKRRGYTERIELAGKDGEPQVIKVIYGDGSKAKRTTPEAAADPEQSGEA